jgi:hypothetical protein
VLFGLLIYITGTDHLRDDLLIESNVNTKGDERGEMQLKQLSLP